VPTVGRERTVLVIEDNNVIDLHPGGVICALVDVSGEAPETWVTVPISEPIDAVVMAPDISAFRPVRFEQGKYLGDIPPEAMERIDVALRAVLAL
jgi:mRNA interferase MazF